MRMILASASPRRKELLGQIGWDFEICVSRVEEKITKTLPEQVVCELSSQKAEEVFGRIAGERETEQAAEQAPGQEPERPTEQGGQDALLVIGADTVVSCEGRILGKPHSREEALSMLRLLQGRTHHVYTGVTLCLRTPAGRMKRTSFYEETAVTFYPMSEEELEGYVDTEEPYDKAGSYGIQGIFARYIRRIEGDYSNVVGLPVGRLYQEVRKLQREGSEPRAVIFDLDGTLSDSLASIKYCADQAVAPYGYGPFSVEQYRYFVGDGAANLIRRCLKAGGDGELVHFEEAYAAYREIFRENCMYEVRPYDGIPELLRALKERGVRIAVLSNKPHAETVRVIETLFGKGCFDMIQGQEPGLAIKPDPEGGRRILKAFGVTAEETLYLGDTATDMRTGKALGAVSVGALWGFRDRKELEEAHADACIAHPNELLEKFFAGCS